MDEGAIVLYIKKCYLLLTKIDTQKYEITLLQQAKYEALWQSACHNN